MLYYLFNYLEQFDFPGCTYVRVRIIPFTYGYHSVITYFCHFWRIFYQLAQKEANYRNTTRRLY